MPVVTGPQLPDRLHPFAFQDLEKTPLSPASGEGYRLPGLVDLHIHGAFGFDFTEGGPDRIEATLDRLLEQGLTGIVPTLITCPEEMRMKALADLNTVAQRRHKPPHILGIYLEGPFLSPVRRGSHPLNLLLRPDPELLIRWQKAAGGLIKLITIAPELENALPTMEAARKMGIIPAVGHTDADHATALKAMPGGCGHVTHLYNAMRSFTHREPSVLSAIFSAPQVMVELIGDGIHVAPEIVSMTFQHFGADRIVLVSDAVCPMGNPDGIYQVYGTRLILENGRCALENGKLFGGGMPLASALVMVSTKAGVPLEWAARSASHTPMKALGLPLPPGDVLFDREFRWLATRQNSIWYWREEKA